MKINDIRIRELVWCWFTSHAPYCSAVSNFSKRVVTGGRRQGLPLMNGNGLGPTTKLLCDPETRPDPTQRASCSTLTILIKTRSAMLMPSSCPWQCCVNSLARTWTFAHLYNVIRHQQECRRRGQSYSWGQTWWQVSPVWRSVKGGAEEIVPWADILTYGT